MKSESRIIGLRPDTRLFCIDLTVNLFYDTEIHYG